MTDDEVRAWRAANPIRLSREAVRKIAELFAAFDREEAERKVREQAERKVRKQAERPTDG